MSNREGKGDRTPGNVCNVAKKRLRDRGHLFPQLLGSFR
ncbi:hypothetical protein T4D_10910 [Trichinella pseudospiralis]|uniref:Uncharacterized protein n=1 Tax=Trichinella pseudospiralis TaxID=6337 RepID=A0A0V1E4D5_TRIPS|nr:hypothetical protein T4D_10910 [Trichinella pseudospiralis]